MINAFPFARFSGAGLRGLGRLAIVALASAGALAQSGPDGLQVVQPHTVYQGLSADATVEAVVQATVASQVAGRLVDVRVDAGQSVRKGELLMRIDAREAAEAAQSAQSQLAVAQAQYERSKQLRQQNFISQAGLDKARADYDAARAVAVQAGVGLGYASVTAPISGVVARRHTELGEMAAPGKALVTVYDPAGLRVIANIPQFRLQEMRGAKSARIEFPELNRGVDAASFTLLPTADADTHVSQVRVNLPAGQTDVRPGMFARVTFVTGAVEKLTVPATAVVRRGEVTAVYVGGEKGLSMRQVRLGETYAGNEIEVLAGLAAGERVALDPIRAGMRQKEQAAVR